MFGWLTATEHQPIVGAVSFFVTLAGLGMTFWQSLSARRASEAAKHTALQMLSKLGSFNAVHEAAQAMAALRETHRHLTSSSWESAAASYSVLRTSLVRLSQLTKIESADQGALKLAITDISGQITSLEKASQSDKVVVNAARAKARLRDYEVVIERITITLQKDYVNVSQ